MHNFTETMMHLNVQLSNLYSVKLSFISSSANQTTFKSQIMIILALESRNPPVDSINLIDQRNSKNATRSAYHLYGDFGEKFPSNGTVIFLGALKTGTELSWTIYKTPIDFPLSLDIKPGTGNPNNWYRQISVVSVST